MYIYRKSLLFEFEWNKMYLILILPFIHALSLCYQSVCVCVCVCAHMCVCVHICECVCTYVSVCICLWECVCVSEGERVCVSVYLIEGSQLGCVCVFVCGWGVFVWRGVSGGCV